MISAFSIFNDDYDHRIVSIQAPSPSCNIYEICADEKSIGQIPSSTERTDLQYLVR